MKESNMGPRKNIGQLSRKKWNDVKITEGSHCCLPLIKYFQIGKRIIWNPTGTGIINSSSILISFFFTKPWKLANIKLSITFKIEYDCHFPVLYSKTVITIATKQCMLLCSCYHLTSVFHWNTACWDINKQSIPLSMRIVCLFISF